MDLSSRVSSKKHVDLNDVRYQLSEKLRPSANRNQRNSFTLYDDKESGNMSVNDISAAYALSDKKIPIGELLTKMMDFIIDLQDGSLDSEEDAVYAWKFSNVLVRIFDDRIKRGESIGAFDNSLKNAVIGAKIFNERYPNKYTLRTNFYSKTVLSGLLTDVVSTFKEDTIPKIHALAIAQSKENAETHHNEVLDRIAQWAVKKYDCKADSFYELNEDADTGLMYATNAIILHLKNGYDVSILGYIGTEHDNQFCVSLFNGGTMDISDAKQNISQEDVKKQLLSAVSKDPVEPLTKLINREVRREEVLKQQLEILKEIHPMIKSDILKLRSAESIVGKDYIWNCENYRLTHRDLPDGFKVEDVQLPEFDESFDEEEKAEGNIVNELMDAMSGNKKQVKEEDKKSDIKKSNTTNETNNKATEKKPDVQSGTEDEDGTIEMSMADFFKTPAKKEEQQDELDLLFPKQEKHVHNDINTGEVTATGFKKNSTLLPGLRHDTKKEEKNISTSITANAQKVEKAPEEKTEATKKPQPIKSTLLPSQAVKLGEENVKEMPENSEPSKQSIFPEEAEQYQDKSNIVNDVSDSDEVADNDDFTNIADLFK